MTHSFQIVVKMTAQHAGIGKADAFDSKAIDQARQRGMGGALSRCNELIIRPFAESLHLNDRFTMAVQMKYIICFMDESGCNEFLQSHLRQPIDI